MKYDFDEKLYNEIVEYCKINDITDIDKFIKDIVKDGFTKEKWGDINLKFVKPIPKEIVEPTKEIMPTENVKINIKKTDDNDFYGENNYREIK